MRVGRGWWAGPGPGAGRGERGGDERKRGWAWGGEGGSTRVGHPHSRPWLGAVRGRRAQQGAAGGAQVEGGSDQQQ